MSGRRSFPHRFTADGCGQPAEGWGHDPATFAPEVASRTTGTERFLLARHSAGQQIEPHAHSCPTATLVLRGCFVETTTSRRRHLAPMDVVIKPAGTPHSNEYPAGAECFVIEFASGGGAWADGLAKLEPLTGDGRASALALRVYQRVFRSPDLPALAVEEDLVRFLEAVGDGRGEHPPARAPDRIDRVRERLADAPEAPPALAALAAEAEVHPAHLCRAFRQRYGMTMSAYTRRQRVHRAMRAIATRSIPLSSLALQLGYCDQAHLTRDFGSVTGFTPGAFRRLAGPESLGANLVQDFPGPPPQIG